MSLLPWRNDEPDVIRPSLMHNGFLALGCLVLGVALFAMENAKIEGALFMALFLLASAAVIMATHLPGCTGIWLDDDGFLTRNMYKAERYRWTEVGPFTIRRRLLGSTVDFPYTPPGEDTPQSRSLPYGMGLPGWRIARRMNERRNRALASEN
jgi:hypothetical protein